MVSDPCIKVSQERAKERVCTREKEKTIEKRTRQSSKSEREESKFPKIVTS